MKIIAFLGLMTLPIMSMGAPSSPVHGKSMNVKQIEFLDKTKGNYGQKIISTITTPMVLNGVITQDIGTIILGEEDIIGNENAIFPKKEDTIQKLDIAGYQATTVEYLKAIRAVKLWCSTNDAYMAKYEVRCTGENGNCRTVQISSAKPCNAEAIVFNNYLNHNKNFQAPVAVPIQVCVANCSNNNSNKKLKNDEN